MESKAEKKKVVVVGGSGFLGSHVADELSQAGYKVRIYDLVESEWIRPGQEMIVGNLLDKDQLARAIQGADFVYNFASLADLNIARYKPLETIETNILGNMKLLETCRMFNVRRFVYASTVYVYSREGGFYRCSKQAAEEYLAEYQKIYGLDYTILRYGSLYGPRAGLSNGLFRIVKNAVETGTVRYDGSPDAMREYIHVGDAARASVIALGDEYRNKSLVLTGQEAMRVGDILCMLAEMLNLETDIEFANQETPGHYVRTPYAYRPRAGLKYVPPLHVDLGQGLLELIQIIADNHKSEATRLQE